MAQKKTTGGLDLIVAELKKNKKADYASIEAKAAKKGIKIYPVMYGRAKLLLGMVKAKPKTAATRGPGRPKKIARRGPGRPRKVGARRGRPPKVTSPIDAVNELVSSLRQQEKTNMQLRVTLEKVRDLIDRVIA